MRIPESLRCLKTVDVLVGLFFLVVVLPVSVSDNVVLSQRWEVNLLSSDFLNSNECKFHNDEVPRKRVRLYSEINLPREGRELDDSLEQQSDARSCRCY